MTRILGCDPGSVSAAIAMITPDQVFVADCPVIGKNINASALARTLREWAPDCAAVELVGAFPGGQGISSAFQFGRGFGTIIGILGAMEVPVHFYTPTQWKKHFNLVGKREDKDAGRVKAIELFPWVNGLDKKRDANRADALLLAHFHQSRA